MSKRKKIITIIIVSILLIVCCALGGAYVYATKLIGKIERVEVNKENIGITKEVEEKLSPYSNKIINIALFGIDAVEGGVGRSDSIMIATIDTVNKKLKLTSVMRDSYVNIDGYGNDKLNHAYAFGGGELAIKTLNENFNLNIKDFIIVNFTTLPNIIDKIGGIEIKVDEEEIDLINRYAKNIANRNGTTYDTPVVTAGYQKLNGTQVMGYSRIRYTSGGDYKRTERQREVLEAVFNKILELPVTRYPGLLNEILPMLKTTMSQAEIIGIGNEVIKSGISKIEKERFPLDNYSEGKMIDGIYYLVFDKAATINQMHQYIFEDRKIW